MPQAEGRRTAIIPPGIRARILILVLVALLPSLILISQLARANRNETNRKVNAETLRLARMVAIGLERDMEGARGYLAALSLSASRRGSAPRCPERIRSLSLDSLVFDAVGLADTSGAILCQSPAAPGPRLDSLEWFAAAKRTGSFAVGYDLAGTVYRKVTMDFAQPLRGRDGRVEAILYCATDLEWLNRMAEQVELPAGASMAVTSRGGRTLVRYPHPERFVGKVYPDSPMSRMVLDQREGLIEAPGLDGVMRLYAFSHLGKGELAVRIGIPRSQAYAAGDTAMRGSLIALGAVGAMALLAAWLAGHFMVVRQVRRLVETTRSLAAGNLEARTGMGRSGGELSLLAQAFDEMAESLEWRLAQLRESESERSLSLDRFRHLVERVPDAILGVDGDLKLFFCNQGAERMFGRGREELEGMELADLLDRAGDWKGTVDALRNPRLDRLRADWARGDGTSFGAEASVARAERRDGCIYTLIVRERKP